MLITIIIPTYNRKEIISRSIESVVNQTFDHWELIIVDDGSNDGTNEEVKKYLVDERIKFLEQAHQGVSTARNAGLRAANGNYVIFLDSDDMLHPELIGKLYSIDIDRYDLVCWEVMKFVDGKQKLWKPRKMGGFYNNIVASFLAGSICYKKSLINKVGGYDPKMSFGENYELGLRISRITNLKIEIINSPLSYYYINTKTRSSSSYENRMISGIHQYEKHKKIYDKNPRAKSEMTYILGFLSEKTGKKEAAIEYFKSSFRSNHLNYKAMLKILYLNFFK